jgi:CubicO group peptidase (beta-lactamase class C family)
VGAVRWERVLKHARLQAPPTRPVPEDLDQALAEIVSLRHVLTHRGGRVDHRALRAAPSLAYTDGELVRLRHGDYRLYSAALYTYGEEVIHRLMGSLTQPVDLKRWRQNYTLGA